MKDAFTVNGVHMRLLRNMFLTTWMGAVASQPLVVAYSVLRHEANHNRVVAVRYTASQAAGN